jgi:hypothetical protein
MTTSTGADCLAPLAASPGGDGPVVCGMPSARRHAERRRHMFYGEANSPVARWRRPADVEPFPRLAADDLEWCGAMRLRGARLVERASRILLRPAGRAPPAIGGARP